MGNKLEVLGFKAKLWGPGGKVSSRRRQQGVWGRSPQFLATFVFF